MFERIVAEASPAHFVKTDTQLLGAYVQACFLVSLAYESALASPSHMGNWVKATKTMVTLGRQLRLAPISRTDPKTLAWAYAGRSYAAYPDQEAIATALSGTGLRDWKARG